ncbi:MAG: 4Fe-4S dicluster domain-containing protein [Candidatus Rokubacteria bacterium]|nr:4Fe-4S dicluster domain-containing protein [Candidatus Rokubacteria bacterium]MBI3826399.1 4Fe-4S dicluster domain-containing protein [Candidatus Rokubacteria bacterium]
MAHGTTETPAPPAPPAPLALHGLSVEGVNQCVHCGLCLASCPTFSELGTEMDSPRGRIFLIKSLAEGRLALSDSTVRHLSLCLDCRACETVCPAGVPYGRLIEAAKAEIERQRPGGAARRAFRWINLGLLLEHPRLLALAAAGLRAYQVSGLQRLVRASGLARVLPSTLAAWEALTPAVPAAAARAPLPALIPAVGARRARVALLTGCVQSVVFGDHNRATARVLARNGCDVVVPAGQGCCGALNAHAGDHARAVRMAKATIETFERAGVRTVIVNTSGCGAHMKGYGALLANEPSWASPAARFAASVQDVSEFLAREPLRGPLAPVAMTVTYHDPCHVVHGQKIRAQPRQLLAEIPGLRIVELAESDWCCGSAGIYNLTEPEMAERLLRRKVGHVLATGAEAVVTANPGCILQIAKGVRDRGAPTRVLHLVELLDRAYGAGR